MSNGNYSPYNIPGVGEYNGYCIWSGMCSGVIGVQGGRAAVGTPLVLYYPPEHIPFSDPVNPPTQQWLNDNAYWLWALRPGPAPYESSYYIISLQSSQVGFAPLVIDIQGGNAEPGTPLVISIMAGWSLIHPVPIGGYSTSQLWNVVVIEPPPDQFSPGVMFQNVLDTNFVFDLTNYDTAAGTPLELWTKKPTGTSELNDEARNQTWAPGMIYYPGPQ